MRKLYTTFLVSLLCASLTAQTIPGSTAVSASHFITAFAVPDRTVHFNLRDSGVHLPIIWGLDTAWPSESNIRRGVAFMGAERVSVVRASFQPTLPLINNDLQEEQISWLNRRLNYVDLVGPHATIALNCDHPSVHAWYQGNAANWAALMDVTTRRVQERGRTVVSIAPFNEPDYGWGQGTIDDFFNIAGLLRNNPRFNNIRISGGNTLNTDQALPWYNHLKSRLDEGNTHQLAGSFDNYALFFRTVRANGHHASNDELHNVMEAMVGVEYGMQTGIWWGTAELARGEFVKASYGRRLGYAEHRPNWTSASVYRHPDGKVQAFGGASERQAVNTTYRFVSRDRDVFFDGHGPQREFLLPMPGGTGYQQGQPNAERVINITWGDDIQPVINGRYVIVNRNSRRVMEVANGSMDAGAYVRQNAFNNNLTSQQWNVTPVDSRIGGDFSYFTITAVHSGRALDLLNWSLNNNANIHVWDDVKSGNQQWYLEYVEDGWFYIRSRYSAQAVEVANSSTANFANIQQRQVAGTHNQQWRFLPVNAAVEIVPPSVPANLTATPNATSVRLQWSPNTEPDLAGYHIFRAETPGGPFSTLARNITATAFIDNTAQSGQTYYYAIRAVDRSLNRSNLSSVVVAAPHGERELVAHYSFNNTLNDSTINQNHSAISGLSAYIEGRSGSALALPGINTFLQLPATVANHREITIATWVFWRGGGIWQRIFDFGNSETEYLFLTPRSSAGTLRFAIRNGGSEQQLNGTAILPSSRWTHVAVTLAPGRATMYVNGLQVATSESITISPLDIRPVLNYIGRSQFADPMLGAHVDDFRIYNYALSASEIATLAGMATNIEEVRTNNLLQPLRIYPNPAKDRLHVHYYNSNHYPTTLTVFNLKGEMVVTRAFGRNEQTELLLTDVTPGVYLLKITNQKETLQRKFVVTK